MAYPPQAPYPAQPGQPGQGYPPQQQGYGYPLQQGQGYPPQTPYPPQQPQQPQGAPPVNASLSDFYQQPSGAGGPALKFTTPGQSYTGIVARPITDGDVQHQTNPADGRPAFFRDGRPKLVMLVPLLVQHPDFPEGRAAWYVRGQARDELARAMAEAGAPEGAPEPGAAIGITYTGDRPIPGLNPQKQYQVAYRRPEGAEATTETAQAQPQAQAQVQPPQAQPQAQQAPAQAQVPAQPQQGQAPENLSPEQQALLAKLTGS